MLLRSLWLGAFTAYLFLGLSHVSSANIDDSLICKICNGYQICGKKQTQMPGCPNGIPCTMEQYRLCGKMAGTVKSDECDHPGKFPDPKRPRKYFTCEINNSTLNSTSSLLKRTWSCSANKTFDPLTKHCLNKDEKFALETLQNYVRLNKRFVCTEVGIFPDPYDCKMYHSCNDKLESQDFYCSLGTYFDGFNCTNTKRCLKQLDRNSRDQLNQGHEIYKRLRAMLTTRRSRNNSPRFLEESFEDAAGTKYTLYAVGDVQAPNVLSYTQSSIENLQKIIKNQISEQQRMSVDGFLDLEKLQDTVTTIATKSIEEAKIMVDNEREKICDRMQQMVDEGSLRLKVSLFNVMHVTIIQCNCNNAGNDTFKISTNLNPYYTTFDELTNIQTTQTQQNATTKYYINGTASTSGKYYTDFTPNVAVDYENDYQETFETQSSEEDYYYEQRNFEQLSESTFYWYDDKGDTKAFSTAPKNKTSIFADVKVDYDSVNFEDGSEFTEYESYSNPEVSYAQIYNKNKDEYIDESVYYAGNEYDSIKTYKTKTTSHKYKTTSSKKQKTTTTQFSSGSMSSNTDYNVEDEYTDASESVLYADNEYDNTNNFQTKTTSSSEYESSGTAYSSGCDCENEYTDTAQSDGDRDNEYDNTNSYQTEQTFSSEYDSTAIESTYDSYAYSNSQNQYPDSAPLDVDQGSEYDNTNSYQTEQTFSSEYGSTAIESTYDPYAYSNSQNQYPEIAPLDVDQGNEYGNTNSYQTEQTFSSEYDSTAIESTYDSYAYSSSKNEYTDTAQYDIYRGNEYDNTNTYITTSSPEYNSTSFAFIGDTTPPYANGIGMDEYTDAPDFDIYTDNLYDSINTYISKTTSSSKNETKSTDFASDSYSYDTGSTDKDAYIDASESVVYTENEYDSINTYKTKMTSHKYKTKTTSSKKHKTTSTDFSSDYTYSYDGSSNEENEYTDPSESVVYTDNEYDPSNNYETKTTSPRNNKTTNTDFSSDAMYFYDGSSNEENEYTDTSESVVYTYTEYGSGNNTYTTKTTSPRKNKTTITDYSDDSTYSYDTDSTDKDAYTTITDYSGDSIYSYDTGSNQESEYTVASESVAYTDNEYSTNIYETKTNSPRTNKTTITDYSGDSLYSYDTSSNEESEYTVASESVAYTDNEYSTNIYETKTTSPRKNKTTITNYSGDSIYSYDPGSSEENEYIDSSESVVYTDSEYDSISTYKTKTTHKYKTKTTSTQFSSNTMSSFDSDNNDEEEYRDVRELYDYTGDKYEYTNTYDEKTTSLSKNKTTQFSSDSISVSYADSNGVYYTEETDDYTFDENSQAYVYEIKTQFSDGTNGTSATLLLEADTTAELPRPYDCVHAGYFTDPDDCHSFYRCEAIASSTKRRCSKCKNKYEWKLVASHHTCRNERFFSELYWKCVTNKPDTCIH